MRVLIVGGGSEAGSLRDGLESSGVAVEVREQGTPAAEGPEEIAEIAGQLREFERSLGDEGPDAVIVASDSPAALAAVLVATKLGTPTARLDGPEEGTSEGANARLIRQLADRALASDPAAIAEWGRDGYPPAR